MEKFPKNFLWGVAISSYQTEGGNKNSDWWQWENKGKTEEKSGRACDYWHRWSEDHEWLSQLGASAFRLSLEWSRIEPEEKKFSSRSIHHYRRLLEDLKKRKIKTIVTLWHWSSPAWFTERYGWHKKESIRLFSEYVKKVMKELGDLIDMAVTLNEPMVPLSLGYLVGSHPPGYRNPFKFWRALINISAAHRAAYKLIHEKRNIPVGITYLYNYYVGEKGCFLCQIANWVSKFFRIDWLKRKIAGFEDYIGIDYYRKGKIVFSPSESDYFGFRIEEDSQNIMKWKTYPPGIYAVLKEVWQKEKLPIYIMENGMPGDLGENDKERANFIRQHLRYVHRAIAEGVDVRGYNYWSLMDNYEWGSFRFRFGLIEIDFQTFKRRPRKSFYAYRDIIKNNGVE